MEVEYSRARVTEIIKKRKIVNYIWKKFKSRWWPLLLCRNCIDVTLSFPGGFSISLITWPTMETAATALCPHECSANTDFLFIWVHCLPKRLSSTPLPKVWLRLTAWVESRIGVNWKHGFDWSVCSSRRSSVCSITSFTTFSSSCPTELAFFFSLLNQTLLIEPFCAHTESRTISRCCCCNSQRSSGWPSKWWSSRWSRTWWRAFFCCPADATH